MPRTSLALLSFHLPTLDLIQDDAVGHQADGQDQYARHDLPKATQSGDDVAQVLCVVVPEPGEDIRRDQRRRTVNQQEASKGDARGARDEKAGEPEAWKLAADEDCSIAEPLVKALQSCDLLVSNRAREETAGLEADPSPHGERDAVPDDDARVADDESDPDIGLSHARKHAPRQQADVLWYRVSQRGGDQ